MRHAIVIVGSESLVGCCQLIRKLCEIDSSLPIVVLQNRGKISAVYENRGFGQKRSFVYHGVLLEHQGAYSGSLESLQSPTIGYNRTLYRALQQICCKA